MIMPFMWRPTELPIGALVLFLTIGAVTAQDRFDNEQGGRFRGFTKSQGEHIMNEFGRFHIDWVPGGL
jgi:hypothetical protein